MENKKNFYLAGPFFNEDQTKLQDIIEQEMKDCGKTFFSPRLDAGQVDVKTANKKQMQEVFENDLEGIDNCDVLFANVSYRDTGTSFEMGYAKAKGIPIIIFRDSCRNDGKPLNLMLALACGGQVIENLDDLVIYLIEGKIPDNSKFNFEIE